jgi:uncharacterized protein involved in exopolysaccharide biosynthesis
VLVVLIGLAGRRTYSSSLSFVPQVSDAGLGGAGGLAAQLGVSVPGSDLTQTPDFYTSLLQSDQFERQLVESQYRVKDNIGETLSENLISIFEIESTSGARSRDMAVEALDKLIRVSNALKTGVVQFQVTTDDPSLSLQVARRALALVNQFNMSTRRSRYGQESAFLASRIVEAQAQLKRASDSLQSFLDNNRDYANSPPLLFVHDRLQTEVAFRTQLYGNFTQRYEDARVQEARNTPVITVVEAPILATRPVGRFLAYKAVAAAMFGGLATALYIVGRFLLARMTENGDRKTNEFIVLWRETADDFRKQFRRYNRVIRFRRSDRV